MYFRKTLTCPVSGMAHQVFLDESELPPHGERYSYRCQGCGGMHEFAVGAVVVVKQAPEGATLAQRARAVA